MNKLGDIIYIDDDVEDCEVFAEVYETIRKELDIPNNLRVFHHAIDYLEYIKLTTDEPALILCDINMPKITGIDLRKVILEDVKQNVTPFILYSTSLPDKDVLEKLSKLNLDGLFIKSKSYQQMISLVKTIVSYWMKNSKFTEPDSIVSRPDGI